MISNNLILAAASASGYGQYQAPIPQRKLYFSGIFYVPPEIDGTGLTQKNSPIQIDSGSWSNVSIGGLPNSTYGYTVGIKTDGTLWSWGYNELGQLGLGDTVTRSTPTQIGTDNNWSVVEASWEHTFAIKTDGTLWAWGANSSGRLGLGYTLNRSSPLQVGSLTNWSKISSNGLHTLAIKTDGTLWAWGLGTLGRLGNNATSARSSPVQIGLLNDWIDIAAGGSHSMAIRSNKTLWTWGANNSGQLGLNLNTSFSRSSPSQVAFAPLWASISAGRDFSAAVLSNGTLWTWGRAFEGQLGDGISSRSSPLQVGTLTNWSKVFCGHSHTIAIKTDGTLWSWGVNDHGQLGLGDTGPKASPNQIGSKNSWLTADSSMFFSMFIENA